MTIQKRRHHRGACSLGGRYRYDSLLELPTLKGERAAPNPPAWRYPNLGLDGLRALPWASYGACVGDPTPWIEGTREAYVTCLQKCPVLAECLEWSETDEAKRTGMVVAGKPPDSAWWDNRG